MKTLNEVTRLLPGQEHTDWRHSLEEAPRRYALLDSKIAEFLSKNVQRTSKKGGPIGVAIRGQTLTAHTRKGPDGKYSASASADTAKEAHALSAMFSPKKKMWTVKFSAGAGHTSKKKLTDDEAVKLFAAIFAKAAR